MHAFDIQLVDQNHVFHLGLSRNLLRILKNNLTAVGITRRGRGFMRVINVQFIEIDLHIYTNKLWWG